MTVTVIDLFEEVNVKHCDAKRGVSALSRMNTLLQSIHDPSAVFQSRQVIVAHQVFNLLQRDGQFFITRTESILHATKVGDQHAASDDCSEHDADSEELPDEGVGGHAHLWPCPVNSQRNCNERATPGHPETCTPRRKKAVGTEDQKHNQRLERNLRSCDKQAQHPCNRDQLVPEEQARVTLSLAPATGVGPGDEGHPCTYPEPIQQHCMQRHVACPAVAEK